MDSYAELIPPTAVTHAVALPFTSSGTKNLVVAKTSLLQVFEINEPAKDDQPRLSFVGEYPLYGTVAALAAVELPHTQSGGAALLVATRNAKLSLVEWSPRENRISTISIHYYENEYKARPFISDWKDENPVLTVDPNSRCAALAFGGSAMALIPFRQQDEDLPQELDLSLQQTNTNGDPARQAPYEKSFVIPLMRLDPRLVRPIDLAFLHEYREPTLGVLSGTQQPSSGLLAVRKDCLSYVAITLDIEEAAMTTLIVVNGLPSDLWKVVPLPLPAGGALLVGANELLHVNQSAKVSATAVNEFAEDVSDFPMLDQSYLNMKLEGCEIGVSLDPDTGDRLLTLHDGSLAVIKFKITNGLVAGLSVTPLGQVQQIPYLASPSCVVAMDKQRLFFGSAEGPSILASWSRDESRISRKRSHAQMVQQESLTVTDDALDDLDDDDIYATAAEAPKVNQAANSQDALHEDTGYRFEKIDELLSLGPINNICFGRSPRVGDDRLEMVAAVGRGPSSKLAFMGRQVVPDPIQLMPWVNVMNIWSINVASTKNKPWRTLMVYDGETTKVYDTTAEDYPERTGTDFEHEGETMAVGTLNDGKLVVQCRPHEIRTYDRDLGLSQIVPMEDSVTGEELSIVNTSFCDPYLLVLRVDGSLQVLQVQKNGEVDPLEATGALAEKHWMCGCLYAGVTFADGAPTAFLINDSGALVVLRLPSTEPVYYIPQMAFLLPFLIPGAPNRRGEKAKLTDILVADLGPEHSTKAYLIVKDSQDDLTVYEPYYYDPTGRAGHGEFDHLMFRKVHFPYIPFDDRDYGDEDSRPETMRAIKVGNRHMVYLPSLSPSLIVKEAIGPPKAIGLRVEKPTKTMQPYDDDGNFFLVYHDGTCGKYGPQENATFETGWSISLMSLPAAQPEEIRHLAFYEPREVYVIATCRNEDFLFSADDKRHETNDDISMRPQISRYTIHLLSAKTNAIIESMPWPYSQETFTGLKVMPLEVSELTRKQRPMLVIGSVAIRGEDMPAKGAVTVIEIVDVVPHPDQPESGMRMRIVCHEITRGAITSLEPWPGGLICTGQGLRLMIRGLREDGTCLPVAFLDAQCFTTQFKSLPENKLWLAGDALQGLWFGCWTEEPYRLNLLGKTRCPLEVVTAEFLPTGEDLDILIIDPQTNLNVYRWDPHAHKAESGMRLIKRCSFHLGHFPTSMVRVPSTLYGDNPATDYVLVTFSSGAMGCIAPIEEASCRPLTAMEVAMTGGILDHTCALNQRAYRSGEPENAKDMMIGRGGVVDGEVLKCLGDLGVIRRNEVLGEVGFSSTWGFRTALLRITGGGLGFV
ncbi:hypothetical protein K470DRAFT_259479 [Piedraia hortae CBS 480.64]|uniref:Protein CFT1 n=1 Tax=Piedraia hortae CBS 480.64 TaxID=1314780 RepID=A0A6A7BU90_9PEZI|nr:hypothetical protein K470DRAFT_259479 [Piedraia hortae CBS 480.64]